MKGVSTVLQDRPYALLALDERRAVLVGRTRRAPSATAAACIWLGGLFGKPIRKVARGTRCAKRITATRAVPRKAGWLAWASLRVARAAGARNRAPEGAWPGGAGSGLAPGDARCAVHRVGLGRWAPDRGHRGEKPMNTTPSLRPSVGAARSPAQPSVALGPRPNQGPRPRRVFSTGGAESAFYDATVASHCNPVSKADSARPPTALRATSSMNKVRLVTSAPDGRGEAGRGAVQHPPFLACSAAG